MSRIFGVTFGVFSYLVFFVSFVYTVGFLADFGVPKTVDSAATSPAWLAVIINLGLFAVFAVQHSVMARPGFKRWWTRIVPEHLERSIYVLLSVVVVVLLYWGWQPIEGTVWSVQNETLRGVLWAGYLAGYATIFLATVLLNHFDLFGLRQVWLHAKGEAYTDLPFKTPFFYKHVRHPLYVGWLMAFWITPEMSVGHLFFAGACSAYIFVALIFEERDLVAHFGETYREYRRTVPSLMPRFRGRRVEGAASANG